MNPLLTELVEMHTYCRPFESTTERAFRDTYVRDLGAWDDDCGNLHIIVGDGSAKVLFSCHTDTVHGFGGRQTVTLAPDGRLRLSKRSRRIPQSCLGADDTVGVFLMRQMAKAGVRGHYVFHSGEEQGCIGSQMFARQNANLLNLYDYAIAFDRKDFGDVITHQRGRRTASQEFALALAHDLNLCGLDYAPSDHGLYTDTESYEALIPECTNLSIGYEGNHGKQETVSTCFVLKLLDALLQVDWANLPCVRVPTPLTYLDSLYEWEDDATLPVARTQTFLTQEYEDVQSALLKTYYQKGKL